MSDPRTFVVPYDFSDHAEAALSLASDFSRELNADIHLVHVIQPPAYAFAYGGYSAGALPPPPHMASVREGAVASLRRVASRADLPGEVQTHVVEGGAIPEVIWEIAEKLAADLIVMGTHGRTGLRHAFLGSVAERTLRRAPCPVLTVQAPQDEGSRPPGAPREGAS